MKIIFEGKNEMLKKLERIQELSKELYREVAGLPSLVDIKYTPEEITACDNNTDGD